MKLRLTIFLLICANIAFSQDSTAKCLAKWKKGDKKVLMINHTKVKYNEGKIESNFSFDYIANVEVIDATILGYTMQWTYHLTDEFKKINPALKDSMPVYEGLKIKFKTTETGEYKDLLNWEEVRDAYIKMMELSLPKKLDSTAQAAINMSKELFNSKEMVETSMIKDVQLYHGPYGGEFSTTEHKVDTEMPTPLGDEPMAAVQTSRISEFNKQQDYFKVQIEQKINPDGLESVMTNLLKKMNAEDKPELKEEIKKVISSLDISDKIEYQVTQSSGWIKNAYQNRTAKTGDTRQTESFLIKMKE